MTRVIAFFSFFLIVIITFWFLLPTSSLTPETKKPENLPDAWMEMVDATFMNENGQVFMKIHSPKLVHYAQNDTSELTAPQFILYDKRPTPWHIKAGSAVSTSGIKQIHLSNLVNLHHPADDFHAATWVDTDKLIIHPEQKTAETRENVTLTQPNIHISGKGLQADLKSGEIKILSETRGEYVFTE